MVAYKADGTEIHPTAKDPNARQAVKAGDVPRTPPTPADLEAVHRGTAATAEAKRKAAYLNSPDLGIAILARLDALEAQVAALEAAG